MKFSLKVSDFFADTFMSSNPVSDWDAFFQYLAKKLQFHPSKVIIVIDEVTFPFAIISFSVTEVL